MGNSSNRDARRAKRAELARKALELRKAGANHEQIADQLKLANRSVSWKLVQQALHAVIEEPAREVLKLELARLDAMLLGCWSKAKSGDAAAIDRALRIMERRAAYLGLDQPRGMKIELARNMDAFIERVRGVVTPDVFERILAAVGGVDGPAEAGRDSDGAGDAPNGDRDGEFGRPAVDGLHSGGESET